MFDDSHHSSTYENFMIASLGDENLFPMLTKEQKLIEKIEQMKANFITIIDIKQNEALDIGYIIAKCFMADKICLIIFDNNNIFSELDDNFFVSHQNDNIDSYIFMLKKRLSNKVKNLNIETFILKNKQIHIRG